MSHKLGPGLHVQLGALERAQREREAQGEAARAATPTDSEGGVVSETSRVTVFVRFTGDPDRLREAGLMVEMISGDIALGSTTLGGLERLAAVDEVLSINEDHQQRPMLNHSVPAIHADHVRTGALGLTGKGVVVGVVDSGIDIFHENFQTDDKKTRILSLLDMTVANFQTLWLSGVPTGGSFTLAWTPPNGDPTNPMVTGPIPFNAAASAVASALVALPGGAFNVSDAIVTGGAFPSNPVTVDLSRGKYANQPNTFLLVQGAGTVLTGGSSPGVESAPGKVFTPDDINAALPHPGTPFPSTDGPTGHGTHVAGIATGDGSQSGNCCPGGHYIGVAPNADLVVVKTDFDATDTMRGAKYVFFVADNTLPAPEPAVVNLSLGDEMGAHDGTNDDERAYDNMLVDANGEPIEGRSIVVAAGNDGATKDPNHPAAVTPGLHAATNLPANQPVNWTIHVPAADKNDDDIDIWYEGAARLTLTLTVPPTAPPGHKDVPAPVPTGGAITASSTNFFVLAGSPVRVTSIVNAHPTTWPDGTPRSKHRIRIKISAPPAAPPATGTGPIANGPWTIALQETAGAATPVNAWIRSDPSDENLMFDPGQQTQGGSLTMPGTARNVITVGSYDWRDSTLEFESSHGPTTDDRTKPDLVAPGASIVSAEAGASHRWWWWDCCCDFYVGKSGTSMATPHVTGVAALLLERNRHLTFDEIRSFLTLNCMPPSPLTGPPLPNDDWGHGIVNAEAAANAVPAAHAPTGPVGLPAGATWAARAVTPKRIAALRARLGSDPRGAVLAALVSTHFDEVKRLVNTNRRILIVWHRMGGPDLLGRLMRYADTGTLELSAQASGPLVEWLERMLALLHEYGSPALQADVARHRDLALALVSSRLPEYDEAKLAS